MLGQFAFEREHISDLAIVAFAPDMGIGPGIN